MLVAKVVIQTAVANNTQFWNDHSIGLSNSALAFNANPPANINSVSTGLGLTTDCYFDDFT